MKSNLFENKGVSLESSAKLKERRGSHSKSNIQKQKVKVQKLHHKIDNVRTDYINKTIAEIVKTKPSYITIEDLNVKGMMKNRYLSKSVASQKFYEFRAKLPSKCNENGIRVKREADGIHLQKCVTAVVASREI